MDISTWHIGCSGFHYREWKEIFYPKELSQTKWFSFYAERFNTLEINNTFYKFPDIKLFENWYNKSPKDFIFSVKVPGSITHYKQFIETQTLINDLYDVANKGLKEKLGCILFQLPPRAQFSMQKLENIVRQMNPSFNNVIEFRDQSWWNNKVLDYLREKNICFCGVSFPGLTDEPVYNLPLVYYRFHGVPKLYSSEYGHEFLKKITDQFKQAHSKTIFLYFNNTASGAALENATFVNQLIK